jgi:hypothetical protein
MKFSTPFLLLASLVTFISAEPASAGTAVEARVHARDFVGEAVDSLDDLQFPKRAAPPVPAGKSAKKLHVWIRTDTRSQTYKDRTGATYEGLNQLIKDTGGKHKDLVVGNSQGYYEYGLGFSGDDWKKKTNADGAKITDYAGEYVEVTDDKTHQSVESYEYMGQVKDKKTTLDDIKKIGKYLSVQHHMLRG